jgi:hypothetical protein
MTPIDSTQASVPTRRPSDTARIRQSGSDVRVFPKPAQASNPPAPVLPSHRSGGKPPSQPPAVVVRPRGFVVAILFAVGGVSFFLASLVLSLVALMVLK